MGRKTQGQRLYAALDEHLSIHDVYPYTKVEGSSEEKSERGSTLKCPEPDCGRDKLKVNQGDGRGFRCTAKGCGLQGYSVIDFAMYVEPGVGAREHPISRKDAMTELAPLLPKGALKNYPGTNIPREIRDGQERKPVDVAVDIIQEKNKVVTVFGWGKEFYWFNGKYYELDGAKGRLTGEMRRLLGDDFTDHVWSNAQRKLFADTRLPLEDIEEQGNLICVENGILDLDTFALQPHTPDLFFTWMMPVAYDEEADTGTWEQYVRGLVADDSDYLALQEAAGYPLMRDCRHEKALLVLGTGQNGKTLLFELLVAVYGDLNCEFKDLVDFASRRDSQALGHIRDRMVNICGDIGSAPIWETSTFKRLVSGEWMSYRPAYARMSVRFKNRCKLMFAANSAPQPKNDDTPAFFRRWILVTFPYTFDNSNPNSKPRVELKSELLNNKEAIFLWMVQGYRRLIEQGGFTATKTAEDIREQYVISGSPVKAFGDAIKIREGSPQDYIFKDHLLNIYKRFAAEHGVQRISNTIEFTRKLREWWPFIDPEKRRMRGKKRDPVYSKIVIDQKADIVKSISAPSRPFTTQKLLMEEQEPTSGGDVADIAFDEKADIQEPMSASPVSTIKQSKGRHQPFSLPQRKENEPKTDKTHIPRIVKKTCRTSAFVQVKLKDQIRDFIDSRQKKWSGLAEGDVLELPRHDALLLIDREVADVA
jgi:P4 family phage/plasmid primase-like protien